MNRYTDSSLSEVIVGGFITINNARFTIREVDVIAYLCSGNKPTSKNIAAALSISHRTAENHIRNIFAKTQSRVRDNVVDFIEKSDKQALIQKHYQTLQNYAVFNQITKHVLETIASSISSSTLIIYDAKYKDSQNFADEIEDILKQAGLKSVKEAKNLTTDVAGLIKQPVPNGIDKIIYIVSDNFLKLQTQTKADQLENPPFSYDPVTLPAHNKLFILYGRKETTPIPKVLQKNSYIELKEGETYYKTLVSLLKQLTLNKKSEWKEIESRFKWHKEEHTPDPKTATDSVNFKKEEETRSTDLPAPSSIPQWLSIIKKLPRLKELGIVCLALTVLGALFIFFKYGVQDEDSFLGPSTIHSELAIPLETVLLKRSNLLTQLAEKLKGQEKNQNIVLVGIAGMGGVGKTTLARQFGRLYKTSVVWEINAETITTLMSSFKDLAYELAKTDEQKKQLTFIEKIHNAEEKEKQLFAFVRQHLKEHSDWLLIYDNVESFSTIKPYFPTDPHIWGCGKVVVTTRDANMEYSSYMKSEVIHIEELTESESLTLFSKILYKKEPNQLSLSQKEEALAFLKHIPPFPLDISTAAYYIKNNRLSFQQYLERITHFNPDLDHSQQTLLKEVSDYSKTRYGIITSSLATIVENNKDFQELLLLVSLIDSQNIPRSLLEFYKNPSLVDSFIHDLKKYSLITAETRHTSAQPHTFSVHRSTQDICRSYLMRNLSASKQEEASSFISTILEKYLNYIIDKESIQEIILLKNHCSSFLNNSVLTDDVKETLGFELGCIYYHLGENAKAQQSFEGSLSLTNRTENDARKAKTFMYLGTIYRDFGKFELSKEFLEKSVDIYRKKFPAQQINIARILAHLGNIYKDLSEPEKAKDILEESLLIFQRHPDNKAGVPRVLTYLGTIYRELGQYRKAQELLEKSVSIYSKQPDNPLGLALSLARLGNLYRELGEYKKAKNCLEKSLETYRKNSSENNVNIGWALSYLGLVYWDLGYYEKAKEFFEEGLLIHQRNYKEDNINLGWILTYLGCTYVDLGDYEKAKNSLEKSLSIYEKNCKDTNINIGWACLYLGIVYKHLGNTEKAKVFLDRSFLIYEGYFTKDNVDVAWIFPYLGDIYRKLDTYIHFRPLNENLLASYEKRYGERHLRTALILKSLGDIYLMKKEYEKAEASLSRSLRIFEQINHPDRHLVLESLASIFEQRTNEAEKEERFKESVTLKKQTIQYLTQALTLAQTVFPSESAYVKRIKLRLEKLKNVSFSITP